MYSSGGPLGLHPDPSPTFLALQVLRKIQKTRLLHLAKLISPLGRIRAALQIPLLLSVLPKLRHKKPREEEKHHSEAAVFLGRAEQIFAWEKVQFPPLAPLHIPLCMCLRKCKFCLS